MDRNTTILLCVVLALVVLWMMFRKPVQQIGTAAAKVGNTASSLSGFAGLATGIGSALSGLGNLFSSPTSGPSAAAGSSSASAGIGANPPTPAAGDTDADLDDLMMH